MGPDRDEDATSGDAKGVPVPHDHALEGSSEEFPAVSGVRPHPDDPAPEEGNRGGRSF
jgi:hypothetical protein